ncbi:MAG: STAS domain-containing protein [Pseudomonadota bacterium]
MNITNDTDNKTTTIHVAGRLDFEAAGAFQKEIESAVAAAAAAGNALIIDCAGLEYVSSAGLRVFLVGARAAKGGSVPFAVYALTAAVKEVFEVSGFGRIIDVLNDRAGALEKVGRTA